MILVLDTGRNLCLNKIQIICAGKYCFSVAQIFRLLWLWDAIFIIFYINFILTSYCRFLPFALETGVVLQQLPLASPSQPIHHVKIERTSVVFSRKIISKHHYVITNKSEKEIELLLEHPKSWSSDPTSISLVVEECYYGSEKSKSQIEVKTEYPKKIKFKNIY